jgi:hypothetical protein
MLNADESLIYVNRSMPQFGLEIMRDEFNAVKLMMIDGFVNAPCSIACWLARILTDVSLVSKDEPTRKKMQVKQTPIERAHCC